ncbi:MAG: hypothetical protein GX303_08900 [Clostridiales bacterium]|nr:hypothetical protein [Clostridiales bacterium]
MHLDRNALQKILQQSDAQLWQTIRMIAAQSGVDLPMGALSPSDMAALRSALGRATDSDIERALKMLDNYRKQ